MSKIRAKNTKPELVVRSLLHRLGYRFRLHIAYLPGKPDIVLKKHRLVIFVHGCFWHQHKGCKRATLPKTNQKYWLQKLEKNVKRFQKQQASLTQAGWKVIVIWECETKNIPKLAEHIDKLMHARE